MDANNLETIDRSLLWWNRTLAVLAWLGIVWSLYMIGDAFAGRDFSVAFNTKSGVKVLTDADFSLTQRWLVVLIIIPAGLCWIYCLWQIVKLSRQFSLGEIFSSAMVKCLERFGYGLAAQGLAEAVMMPILSAYLVTLHKIEPVEDQWQHVIGGGVLTSMMAAVLIIVIARILRIGIRLREEAELTI